MTSCDFKSCAKERKKKDPPYVRNPVICTPETYYDAEFQRSLLDNRRQNQWIFDLIENANCPGEKIYHTTPDWLLARDLHRGSDSRYLVIFKDPSLHSIRDLRAQHVQALKDVVAYLRTWLPAQEPADHGKYLMYFHYMPSVFQLHMHVSMRKSSDTCRAHHVQHVLRNLGQRESWYRDALILYSAGKSRSADQTKTP
jgi:diadenosine tetraphosphate (Ap4A) HIT family hydrolase